MIAFFFLRSFRTFFTKFWSVWVPSGGLPGAVWDGSWAFGGVPKGIGWPSRAAGEGWMEATSGAIIVRIRPKRDVLICISIRWTPFRVLSGTRIGFRLFFLLGGGCSGQHLFHHRAFQWSYHCCKCTGCGQEMSFGFSYFEAVVHECNAQVFPLFCFI